VKEKVAQIKELREERKERRSIEEGGRIERREGENLEDKRVGKEEMGGGW
jgi:hypothetical protein